MLEGIEVHFLPVAYDNRFSFYARAWSFAAFVIRASRCAYPFRDFDWCYAISVPLTVGLIARWIKFRHDMKFIFEVGDLWPDAPVQMGYVRSRFFQRLLYAMEKSIYRSADSIVALSTAIQSSIQQKVPGKTVHLIPNMADCDFFHPDSREPQLEEKFAVRGKFVISYIGALGVANGLGFFLECAAAVRKTNLPVQFIVCGDGAMRETLHHQAQTLGLQNLSFVDFVNRDGVKELLSVTDAIFVCYQPVPILETGSPNKFFDGLAAGKLIIINFSGWIKKEIEQQECGVYVDPQRPSNFIEQVSPFVVDRVLLKKFQLSARALAEKKYSRKLLGEAFVRLFS